MLKKIEESLEFYNITEEDYRKKCYKCLNIINELQLKDKIDEFCNKLYSNKHLSLLWNYKTIEEVLNIKECEFLTNLILLMGYEYHNKNMKKLNFSKDQIKIHKKRVKDCLVNDIYYRNYKSIRFREMLWGIYFINCRIIEIGNLQYENCLNHIKIHIIRNNELNINDAIKSLRLSKKYIFKYFKIKNVDYYCNSWLLSEDIKQYLRPDSNILKFQSLFDIKSGDSCIDDILNFVFGITDCKNYNELKENTNLQKELKYHLLNNKDIKIGKGKLKIILK